MANDTYFPGAEVLRPGPISQCPDSDKLHGFWNYRRIQTYQSKLGCRNVLASIGDAGNLRKRKTPTCFDTVFTG